MFVVSIREVRADEHGVAGEITYRGYLDVYGAAALGGYADQLRDVASRVAGARVFVGVDAADAILGTVTYVPDSTSPFAEHMRDGEASIRMLSIAPEHKRRGIGRTLSVFCIDRARAEGKRAIALHADEIMGAARKLYEGLGFQRDPTRDFRPDVETFLLGYTLDLG